VVDTGDAIADFFTLIRSSPLRRWAGRLLEETAFRSADQVIVRNRYHVDMLRAQGLDPILIPDGVDLDLFQPQDVSELRASLGFDDVLTVGIQGNFTWYPSLGGGLGWELVHAMALLPNVPLHAILIGSGPGLRELTNLARKLGVHDRVTSFGRVPYEQLSQYLNLCDVSLLTLTNDRASWVRTTGKLPCYMACGRYILASRVGTAADLLPGSMLLDYDGHWDESYPRKLANRLAAIASNPQCLSEGLTLRQTAEQFSYLRLSEQVQQLIEFLAT
jgi:glycosyltransferase involved in cell wall biosynthesis